MNTTITRVAGAAVLFGLIWGFGYYVGANRSGTEIRQPGSSKTVTPIPDQGPGKSSSTTIGGVIAGKTDFGRQMSLHRYAESLNAAAMPGAINEAMQLPLQYRNEALAVLFSRWAELDPAAAVQYGNLLPKSARSDLFLQAAMTAWVEKDSAGTLAWVQSLEKGEARNDALKYFANALTRTDPAEAIKLIKENVPAQERELVYENVFRTWAGHDFAGAMAAAQGIADLEARSRALRSVLLVRSDTEPREVLEFLRTSKLADLRSNVGGYAIMRLCERDLTAARDYVMTQPASEVRTLQIGVVGVEITRRNPREGLAWLEQVPESDRENAAASVFWTWASKDSKAAIEAARGLSDEGLRQKVTVGLIYRFAVAEPSAAGDLLQELPAGSARETVVNDLATHWARENPLRAIEWYMENTGDDQRNGLRQIVAQWGDNDPQEAFKWVSDLPEGEQKGALLARTMAQLMRHDPRGATTQFEKIPAESLRTAVGEFVSNWGYRDPKTAAEWVNTLRDEVAKSKAIAALAGQWGTQDPAATTRWIEKFPAGPDRDAAVASFSVSASKTDPEGAVVWASSIQDPNQSRNTVRRVFTTWLSKDPAAAGNWLESGKNVPAEMRTELLGIQASHSKK